MHVTVGSTNMHTMDAQAGETLARQLCAVLQCGDAETVAHQTPECVTNAWSVVCGAQKSRRVRVRALRRIRRALTARGPPWCDLLNALPTRYTTCPARPRKPDPLLRQRRLVEEDAIPARVASPWVRELFRFLLHHPTQGGTCMCMCNPASQERRMAHVHDGAPVPLYGASISSVFGTLGL